MKGSNSRTVAVGGALLATVALAACGSTKQKAQAKAQFDKWVQTLPANERQLPYELRACGLQVFVNAKTLTQLAQGGLTPKEKTTLETAVASCTASKYDGHTVTLTPAQSAKIGGDITTAMTTAASTTTPDLVHPSVWVLNVVQNATMAATKTVAADLHHLS